MRRQVIIMAAIIIMAIIAEVFIRSTAITTTRKIISMRLTQRTFRPRRLI